MNNVQSTEKFGGHLCPSIVKLIVLYYSLAYKINFTIGGHLYI